MSRKLSDFLSHRHPANVSKTQESAGSGSGENYDSAGLSLTEGLPRPG